MSLKKCIVLDLDNTLWGGIIGEDGMEGIALSLAGAGANFIAFQQALLNLYDRGIILAINSKNNYDDAIKVIREHPNMMLREKHFAAMRINWQDKAQNILELAEELNIGLDAMVFLDDDPVNRAMVREAVPEVDVPDLPVNSADYVKFLLSLDYFPSSALTNEDKMRGNLYVTERLRMEAEKAYEDREQFLESLKLELSIKINDRDSVARLSQLTEKTNQFNVNKKPLSEMEILSIMDNDKALIMQGSLTDRFGDHGLIILSIIDKGDRIWHIKQLLMSCRVIGRGVEGAFLATICQLARDQGVNRISIEFIKSAKNQPAEEFIRKYFNKSSMLDCGFSSKVGWITIKYGKI